MTLLDLAARCESAPGPDRELDAEIAASVRYFPQNIGYVWKNDLEPNVPETGRVTCVTILGTFGPHYAAPHFTASIDAAMMLVPEGCLFVLKTLWDDDKTAGYAIIQHYAPTETGGKRYDGETTALAAPPALALTAAALRARAQIEGGTHAPE